MRPTPLSWLAALGLAALLSSTGLAQGYLCAEGGGNEQNGSWAPAVFGWMVSNAPAGHVIVLGVSGSDNGVANTFLANGAASVTQLNVTPANADLPATYGAITAADIVWMRGGDQSRYVNDWGGTLTEQAIRDVYSAGGVIGGTSAGCAVLGELIYTPTSPAASSLTNREALQDGFHPDMNLVDDFLELTPGVLFDTHFTERARQARLAVMLGRWFEDSGEDVLGIGVDDRTALCVYPDLTAEVRGEGAVTLLHRTGASEQAYAPGEPPALTALRHLQLTAGYVVDLTTRQVVSRPASATLVGPPTTSAVFQSEVIDGGVAADNALGDWQVLDGGDDLALFDGALTLAPGADQLLNTVVSTRVWQSTAFDENRMGGPQWALAQHPHALALYLDGNNASAGSAMTVQPSGHLGVLASTMTNEVACLVLDSHGVVSVDFSSAVSGGGSVGPRQSVALEDARLHVLPSGWGYDALDHVALSPDTAWSSVGPGLSGSAGVPQLSGSGTLIGDTRAELTLTAALAGANATLVFGYAELGLPFKGGVLGPTPDVLLFGLPVGPGGDLPLSTSWPAGTPSDVAAFYQYWIADPAGAAGFSASNTLRSVTP